MFADIFSHSLNCLTMEKTFAVFVCVTLYQLETIDLNTVNAENTFKLSYGNVNVFVFCKTVNTEYFVNLI